tara:strand:+ start:400 stop:711 length:312 start_codon:yes stop_codon:yes gene_type:complete
MNKLNLTHDEYWEKYPVEEVSSEELDIPKEHQITFEYPEVLRDCRAGDTIGFYTDGVTTYFETSGEYQNAGMFKFSDKIFTDMELYEFIYNCFRMQIEDYVDE